MNAMTCPCGAPLPTPDDRLCASCLFAEFHKPVGRPRTVEAMHAPEAPHWSELVAEADPQEARYG